MADQSSLANQGLAHTSHPKVRPGAVVLGLLLLPLNAWLLYTCELVNYSFPTYAAPFYNAIFWLFLLTLANLPLRRYLPKLALSGAELALLYVMLSVASALFSTNMMEILANLITYPHQYTTPSNHWDALFFEYLPNHLVLSDQQVIRDYYFGNSTLWTADTLRLWMRPLLAWCGFTFVLLSTQLALNVILRKQWVEHERLTYPVVQLPAELAHNASGLFHQKLLWYGFALAGAVTLINGLSFFWPAIPYIPVRRQRLIDGLSSLGWRQLNGVTLSLYFFSLAIGFLMPVELSTSCWVFFWLGRMQLVVGDATGWSGGAGFPWPDDQSFGAYLAMFVAGCWSGRKYFGQVLRAVAGDRKALPPEEGRTVQRAALVVVVGVVLLIGFAMAAGLAFRLAVAFFVLYFIMALMVVRIRAEFGFPVHDMHHMGPHESLVRLFSPRSFAARDLTVFSLFHWFNRTYASHPMPHQLEGFKLAERTQVDYRRFIWPLVLTGLVAPFVTMLTLGTAMMRNGAATAKVNQWGAQFGAETFGRLAGWLQTRENFEPVHFLITGIAFCMTLVMFAARLRFQWMFLHPLAYAVSFSWGMHQLWAPILLGGLTKALLLRYGSLRVYRKVLPFVLGLMLGEFVIGALWAVFGLVTGLKVYDVWPGPMV